MSDDIADLKDAEKESVEYESYTPAQSRHKNNWVGGVVLIAIGVIFLLANTTGFYLHNWWALFILIPALANFGNAWQSYQRNGRFTKAVRGSLTGGFILALIASAFLFNLDWGLIWPMFLIIGGLSALLGGWFD